MISSLPSWLIAFVKVIQLELVFSSVISLSALDQNLYSINNLSTESTGRIAVRENVLDDYYK